MKQGSGISAEKSLNVKGSVICLKLLKLGVVAAVDANYFLRFIDPEAHKVLGGFKLPLHSDLPMHVDIGYRGNVCIVAEPERGKARIFSVKRQVMLHRVGSHQGAISCVTVDPLGVHAVTAGEDGKVIAWDVVSGQRAYNAPPHTDEVLAVVFNADASLIATGGYDRTIRLSQPDSQVSLYMLRSHTSAVTALLFAGRDHLVSGDKEGGLALWDVHSGSLVKRLKKLDSEVTGLCCDATGRMMFVATAGGGVALYDLERLEQVASDYLSCPHRITALAYCPGQQRLVVGTAGEEIRIFSIFGSDARLENALELHDYDALYQLARENPAIQFSPEFRRMETQWEDIVGQIDGLILEDRMEQAETMLLVYRQVKVKQTQIKAIRERLDTYAVFKEHVENGRYALAYDLASKHPLFKSALGYRMMEREWERSYDRAGKLLRSRKTEEAGRTLLAKFRGISDKTAAIRELVDISRRYVYFSELIQRGDWKKASEVVRHYPKLQQTDAYKNMLDIADKLFISAQQAYSANEYRKAKQACEALLNFSEYRSDAMALLEKMQG